METKARTQKTYDHRLKELVRSTQDITCAVRHGVPRSTARGWLKPPANEVISIDVVFVDGELTILEIHREVKPWRFILPKAKGIAHVIEFASGWESKCKVGGRTEIVQ
ncbi:MAG: DUF192 domain-containing protein [Planctomycetaceae bacterium]|nr:DUF192 domain-containing protein [Planctomycetaceae bacterium]